jgi:hypothetical protein
MDLNVTHKEKADRRSSKMSVTLVQSVEQCELTSTTLKIGFTWKSLQCFKVFVKFYCYKSWEFCTLFVFGLCIISGFVNELVKKKVYIYIYAYIYIYIYIYIVSFMHIPTPQCGLNSGFCGC